MEKTPAKSDASESDTQKMLLKLKDGANARERELVELVSSIYDKVKDTERKTVDKVKQTANTVNNSVHEYPWPYIGGAAVAGFLLGMCYRR